MRSVVDDPKPGDVLRKWGSVDIVIVIVLKSCVWTSVKGTLSSTKQRWSTFRKWAATAEVITRAGEE